jgi:hypothetical protein
MPCASALPVVHPQSANRHFKVLNYSPTTKSLEIAGDWAIEVGVANATYQLTSRTPACAS